MRCVAAYGIIMCIECRACVWHVVHAATDSDLVFQLFSLLTQLVEFAHFLLLDDGLHSVHSLPLALIWKTHKHHYSIDCILLNNWFTCMYIVWQCLFKVAELPSKHVPLLLVQLFGNRTHPMWTPRIKPVWSDSFIPEPHYTALLTSRSTHNMHKHSWHQRYS